MYVCMYVYTNVACIFMYVCTYACIHVFVYVCMHIYIYIRMYISMHIIYIYLCKHNYRYTYDTCTFMYMCMYDVYVCMHVCMYVCMYICMYLNKSSSHYPIENQCHIHKQNFQ